MNIVECQILFQQKIEDVNQVFKDRERPNTYTIANYLNKAIRQYLDKKYLSLPTYEQRIIAIDSNADELDKLFSTVVPVYSQELTEYNWSGRGKKYRTADNILIPISLACTQTRTEIYPMTGQKVFAKLVTRRQAERLTNDPSDKTVFPKPLFFVEDPYYIILIGDAYTSNLSPNKLFYLRKPFTLTYSYQELSASGTNNLDITSISTGVYFLCKSYCTYVDSGGTPTNYYPGDKVLKVAGYNTITHISNYESVVVGYPWGETDTPDFPDHLHESLVEMSVNLFLDQAKLKLIQKTQ